MNKIFKNVFIRWDKGFLKQRTINGWSADVKALHDRRAETIISEVILNIQGDEMFKIELPMSYLEKQMIELRK